MTRSLIHRTGTMIVITASALLATSASMAQDSVPQNPSKEEVRPSPRGRMATPLMDRITVTRARGRQDVDADRGQRGRPPGIKVMNRFRPEMLQRAGLPAAAGYDVILDGGQQMTLDGGGESYFLVRLQGGELFTVHDNKRIERKVGEGWIVPSGAIVTFETEDDAATLDILEVANPGRP